MNKFKKRIILQFREHGFFTMKYHELAIKYSKQLNADLFSVYIKRANESSNLYILFKILWRMK